MLRESINYLLNKSSALLKLDTKYFAKASFYSGIQQSVGIISGFVISYFFGHFVPKNIYGDYNLILSIIGFLTLVTLPGIDTYLTRSIAQKFDSSFLRSIRIKFLFSLIGVPILLSFALYYSSNIILSRCFIITAVIFPFLAPAQLYAEFLTAKQKFKKLTLFISSSSILSAVLLSLAIFISGSLTLILLAYFLGILIPSIIATTKILKNAKINLKRIDKELIPYGMFGTILSIIPWSASYLGQILLAYNFNTELLATFIVAHRLPLYIHKNLFVFYQPIIAKLASQSYTEHIETLKIHSLKLVIGGLLLALPLYLFSPIVITIIFSEKYLDAIPFAQLLSLSIIPLPLNWVISYIITNQKKKKPRFIATTILSALKIILFIVLIPIYKIYALIAIIILERYLELLFNFLIIYGRKGKKILRK